MLCANNGDTFMSNKLKQTAVRLEPEFHEKLQQLADKDQRPLAGLIRKILHDAIVAHPAAEAAAGEVR